MGIRIKKSMGYATTQFSKELENINDIIDRGKTWYDFRNFLYADETKLLDPIMDKVDFIMNKDKNNRFLYQYVERDDEFGVDGLTLFYPDISKIWSRYDDNIDYAEYMHENPEKDLIPTVKWIRGTIYPYVSLMRPADNEFGVEKYWIPCYLDRDDADDHIAYVPYRIKLLLKFAGYDNKVAHDIYMSLRPCIYTYWG